MKSKRCSKCKKIKPVGQFYFKVKAERKLTAQCKSCLNKAWKAYYKKNRLKLLAKDSIRHKKWYARPESKEKTNKIKRELRKKYPLRYWSRRTFRNAFYAGKTKEPTQCEMCDKELKLEAHHFNYEKPFDVNWVCKKCHTCIHLVHREIEKELNKLLDNYLEKEK